MARCSGRAVISGSCLNEEYHHAALGENSNQPAPTGPFSAHHTIEEKIALDG